MAETVVPDTFDFTNSDIMTLQPDEMDWGITDEAYRDVHAELWPPNSEEGFWKPYTPVKSRKVRSFGLLVGSSIPDDAIITRLGYVQFRIIHKTGIQPTFGLVKQGAHFTIQWLGQEVTVPTTGIDTGGPLHVTLWENLTCGLTKAALSAEKITFWAHFDVPEASALSGQVYYKSPTVSYVYYDPDGGGDPGDPPDPPPGTGSGRIWQPNQLGQMIRHIGGLGT